MSCLDVFLAGPDDPDRSRTVDMVRDLDGANNVIDLEAAVQTRRRSDDCGPRAY